MAWHRAVGAGGCFHSLAGIEMKMAGNTAFKPGLASDRANKNPSTQFDLAQVSWIRPLIESRWPLFLARTITLGGFVFTILVGLFGTPVGSHNFAIIFVWIAWWSALKLAFIPLGGRSWCSVCPLPMPGEWLQRGGLIAKAQKRLGFGLRWPKRLRGYGLQAGLFLLIGLFSALTLTDGRVTAWILLGLILLAAAMSLVFERRAFCSYICPIGGFTGIFATTAPVELRVKDRAICAAHKEKTCYIECPWGVYPLALTDNAACGLCMECLRVCPQDNISLNLRPFGTDLAASGRKHRLDEAFMALVMLGCALSFAAVFTGPWGWLKNAAFQIGSLHWLGYVLGFLVLNLLVLPATYSLAIWLSMRNDAARKRNWRQEIADKSPMLVPLGLFAWIAFTISFALPKLNYVAAVLSDPLNLGWRLMGEVPQVANADVLGLAPPLQITALMVGLVASTRWIMQRSTAGKPAEAPDSKKTLRVAAPMALFCLAYTIIMLVLLVG